MKSRKTSSADDKTQSSLMFFFGKRPPGSSAAPCDDTVNDAQAKKVDARSPEQHVTVVSNKETEPARYTGRRPAGGHDNPGRSRFFARSAKTATTGAQEQTTTSTCGADAAGLESPSPLPTDKDNTCDDGKEREELASQSAGCDIDARSVEELLEAAAQADAMDTIDLTGDEPTTAGDGNDADDGRNSDSKAFSGVPYYLKNFRYILDSVLGDDDSAGLLDESDMKIVTAFLGLGDDAQKLYVRLHNRRKGWHRHCKLDYSEIVSGLSAAIDELHAADLLETEGKLNDLEVILRLLPAPDIKDMAKSFRIQASGASNRKSGKSGMGSSGGSGSGGGKQDLVTAILRHCRQQLSVFTASGTEAPVRKRAKSLLGKCVQLLPSARNVFVRLVHLFAVASWLDDDSQLSNGSSTVMFCTALELEHEILSAKENSQWSAALDAYNGSRPMFDECMRNKPWQYAVDRPQFLLRFTDGWVLSRLMSQCVDVLERHRMYPVATGLLRQLLDGPFCHSSRGRWYDRLALDLDQHLKQRDEAMDVVEKALSDEHVVTGHRLALQQRGVRLCSAASASQGLRSRLSGFPAPDLLVAKEVEITGRMYPGTSTGAKSYFMRNYTPHTDKDTMPGGGDAASSAAAAPEDESESRHIMLLSVEELAMEHYRCEEGFECGIHAEGSTFGALFGLFFWDVIFDDGVVDVFRNMYQPMPLDFYTTHFYEKRKDKVERRLEQLGVMDNQAVSCEVTRVWLAHHGTHCACLNWDLFADMDQAIVSKHGTDIRASQHSTTANTVCVSRLASVLVYKSHLHSEANKIFPICICLYYFKVDAPWGFIRWLDFRNISQTCGKQGVGGGDKSYDSLMLTSGKGGDCEPTNT
eukprot:scpid33083/ scgid3415/ Fanconi-associated nuclease 1; FANCD2/FANCI-associated nuclease 1; Myotubularin-related protein 15